MVKVELRVKPATHGPTLTADT